RFLPDIQGKFGRTLSTTQVPALLLFCAHRLHTGLVPKNPRMITDFTTEWGETSVEPSRISGERRNDRRYSLQLDLKWKLIRRRRLLDTGSGHTIDLSSGGILLETGRHLPEGLDVELSIAWPVLLHNQKPLQLAVCGRIVRSQGGMIAIQMLQHEFRTTG